jgi:lysophospholipase L1-like esterase
MRKTVLAILLLLMVLPATARRKPRYPFIRADLNVVQIPSGESPDLQYFFRKLDTLLITGRGDVRILHVGGSHVQGGTLSDRLRRHFLSLRYGMEGGRGLVFPYSAAGTNTPVSYSSSWQGSWESATCLKPADEELGLTGMAVMVRDTTSRVTLDLAPRERQLLQQRYVFNRVDVLGSGTLEPILLLNGRDTLRGIGTENLRHFDIPYYTDWIQLAFTGQGRYTLRGLYLDKPYGGFSLSEVGVNGASTHSWLRCSLWEQEMHRVMPDMVIFSIGVNDIQGDDFDARRFKANYRELIKRVRRVNPHCAILFTGINDSWRHRAVNPHTAAAEKAFRELAQEFDAALWDWYGIMGGAGSMAQWEEEGLAQSDKIHFTPAGYKLVGDLLFDALMDAYYGR